MKYSFHFFPFCHFGYLTIHVDFISESKYFTIKGEV